MLNELVIEDYNIGCVEKLLLVKSFRESKDSINISRLMHKHCFLSVSFRLIRANQLSPHSINDLSIQQSKNQFFPLDIFSQCHWRPDFKNMFPFKVICDFFSWINPVCLPLIISCSGFQSRKSLHRNTVMLLIVRLHRCKVPTIFLQCDNKFFFL